MAQYRTYHHPIPASGVAAFDPERLRRAHALIAAMWGRHKPEHAGYDWPGIENFDFDDFIDRSDPLFPCVEKWGEDQELWLAVYAAAMITGQVILPWTGEDPGEAGQYVLEPGRVWVQNLVLEFGPNPLAGWKSHAQPMTWSTVWAPFIQALRQEGLLREPFSVTPTVWGFQTMLYDDHYIEDPRTLGPVFLDPDEAITSLEEQAMNHSEGNRMVWLLRGVLGEGFIVRRTDLLEGPQVRWALWAGREVVLGVTDDDPKKGNTFTVMPFGLIFPTALIPPNPEWRGP